MDKTTPAQWEKMILFLAIMLGAWLRFSPTIMASDVINDGGMFYHMTQDLRDQHYALPQKVSYNQLNIPFAYPPLPFYLTALLSDLFRLPLKELFRWLPALVSTGSILAFFGLSRTMLKSSAPAVLATAAFALMPRSFSWFVMGGGVSRALGQIFFLLAARSVFQLFSCKDKKYLFSASLFGALVALSHPGQLLHIIATCAFLWLYLDRKNIFRAASVALGVALLSAPWWIIVISRHGSEAFLAASQTGGITALFWLPLIAPSFSEEQFITLFTVIGLLGLVVCLVRREYLFPLWMLFPFAIDPRSASSIVIIPLAMMTGIGMNNLVIPGINAIRQESDPSTLKVPSADWPVYFLSSRAVRYLIGYFLIASLVGAFSYARLLSGYTVSEAGKEAMSWVRMNTPVDAEFLLLTGKHDPFADPAQEWFPVLAERVSVTTIQGREWVLGRNFLDFRDSVRDLQRCLNADLACVEEGAAAMNLSYDYLYLLSPSISATEPVSANPALLAHLLRASTDYELVYESSEVAIFKRVVASP